MQSVRQHLYAQLSQDPSTAARVVDALSKDLNLIREEKAKLAVALLDNGAVELDAQLRYNRLVGAEKVYAALIEACENTEG